MIVIHTSMRLALIAMFASSWEVDWGGIIYSHG
jgi:hypothetical protein